MERIYPATDENGEYYLYDDNGNGVTNQATLRSLAEAREIAAEWRKSMTSGGFEDKEYANG